eukprot:9281722-Ditylum_brightwellii.AAC.1
MKYNCKAIEDMGEDDPDRETTIDRYIHEWNRYRHNRSLRRPIHECRGDNASYTRPYAKIGGKSKGF